MKLSKKTLSVLCSIIALAAVFFCAKVIMADAGSNMFGYAWSSNIGWIKLNDCDDPAAPATCSTPGYGVTVSPTAPGTISGYAWSSNIGWINFNDATCPTSGCTPGARADWNNPNGDGSVNIRGWARACSVYASGCSGTLKTNDYLGNWDGFIALDSVTAGGTGGVWGLKIDNTNSISGYAWGSEVIGWIQSISGKVSTSALNGATLVANPTSIQKGGSSTLTATVRNIDGANSCTIDNGAPALTMTQGSGGWTGTVSVSPTATTTYTVNCTYQGSTVSGTATVSVTFFVAPTDPNTNGSGSGQTGGYCAVTLPQLAWNSGSSSCTISRQGGGSVSVPGSSQSAGGSLATDGNYYYSPNLPVSAGNNVYTLQCGSTTLTVNVTACVKDFSIVPTPSSNTFVLNPDGKTFSVPFTVSVNQQYGFSDPITFSVDSWPSTIPKSRSALFAPVTLTNAGGGYGTTSLVFSLAAADLKKSGTFPVVIKGVSSGGLVRKATVNLNSIEKVKPVFTEQ